MSHERELLIRYIGWTSVRIIEVSVDSRSGQSTFSSLDSIPALWPAKTLNKCVQEARYVGVKRPGRVADYLVQLTQRFKMMLPPTFALAKYLIKSKGLPRQAEVAQGVPGRLKSLIFLTFRHYKGGKSSAKRTGRLNPRRNPLYSLSEAELTSGHMVLSGVLRKESPVTTPGIDPGTFRLVAQCLNHYANCNYLQVLNLRETS